MLKRVFWTLLLPTLVWSGEWRLWSHGFREPLSAQFLWSRYGCRGRNLSPDLHWRHPPEKTRSFAITLYDPDAHGGGWWHWIVYDLPAEVRKLEKGAGTPGMFTALPPAARQGRNSYGFVGYGGPCPPVGDSPHRYILTLYALNVKKLPEKNGHDPEALYRAIKTHTLGSVRLIVRYGRR